jgi:ureidoacrylate peracid hydrolase
LGFRYLAWFNHGDAGGIGGSTSVAQNTKNVITLEAKPETITIEIGRTALIVVDMQNDFGSKGGIFDRIGIDISAIRTAVGPIARVIRSARQSGIPVIYLKMGFRPDLSDAGPPDAPNQIKHRQHIGERSHAPDGTESRILIRDTWNTDIVSDLRPQPDDIIIYKHRFSGFYQTDLHATLQRLNVKHLVITGCTTSVCVESTIRDAMFRDYSCLLLADCTAEPVGSGLPRSNHEASLLLIQELFGWVSDSAQLLKALEGRPL